jgi:hypothetical protein
MPLLAIAHRPLKGVLRRPPRSAELAPRSQVAERRRATRLSAAGLPPWRAARLSRRPVELPEMTQPAKPATQSDLFARAEPFPGRPWHCRV